MLFYLLNRNITSFEFNTCLKDVRLNTSMNFSTSDMYWLFCKKSIWNFAHMRRIHSSTVCARLLCDVVSKVMLLRAAIFLSGTD
jgi:hypothetical protein